MTTDPLTFEQTVRDVVFSYAKLHGIDAQDRGWLRPYIESVVAKHWRSRGRSGAPPDDDKPKGEQEAAY